MKRKHVTDENIKRAICRVLHKLKKDLLRKGRGAFASSHEIYGILAEELNVELLEAIHQNKPKQIRSELIDVAVGALFAIASYEAGEVRT